MVTTEVKLERCYDVGSCMSYMLGMLYIYKAEGGYCWKCKKKGHFARCCKGARVTTTKGISVDDSEEDSSTINAVKRDGVYDDRDILRIDQSPLSTATHPVVYVVDVRRWIYSLKLREDTMPVINRERGIPFALLPVVSQKLKDPVSKGVLVETSQADWTGLS